MFIFHNDYDTTSSGLSVVILNLIRGLLIKKEKVLLIAKVDGALHNNLKDADTDNLSVINSDKEAVMAKAPEICQSDIIVTTHFFSIFRLFKGSNPKIIFYSVNIDTLAFANRYFNRINFKRATKKLITKIEKGGGLVFIDDIAKEENEELSGVLISRPEYLPIPVDIPEENLWLNNIDKNEDMSFTYLGRAVDWKIFPFRKVLKDINSDTVQNKKVVFHVITDNAKEFEKRLSGIDNLKVRIKYYENLAPLEVKDFLVKNSRVHFGMGTSALDGAKLGVPTILLDFSFEEFPESYRYNFLFSSRNYSVGRRVEKGQVFNGYGISELLGFAQNEKMMMNFSDMSYQYVQSHHEVHAITGMLIKYAANCSIHIRDIAKHIIRYWR